MIGNFDQDPLVFPKPCFWDAYRRGSPEGLGSSMKRGQGEEFPLWVWAKPMILLSCLSWLGGRRNVP
ncbi:hypothetical protein ABE23_00035 [Bacillus thuringiensis]|nr:hypothetical protein [Bacillus thuringiensis]MBG9658073.1 hypothetical protein [Bacillus thuringiensis]OTW39963.1 hypothetical protein BK698_18885 [Bacillus thuringiensis serovar thuringiensis]PGH89804.1 hypothetical protein CN893_30010 [Bacillus thuringiensis]